MKLSIKKLGVIEHTYRHLERYRQIISIFFKYGFGDLVARLRLEPYIGKSLDLIVKNRHRFDGITKFERTRMAFEELGPTFVKLGQILSTRPDLIPFDYVHELEKLQDDLPSFGYNEVERIFNEDFGTGPETLFASFEKEPFAAASLGQVHKARLKTGEHVVVKIMRPGVRAVIETDLEIMMHLAMLMERHVTEFQVHRPTRIVEEFARGLETELDYTFEAANANRIARQFKDDDRIHIPAVYPDILSSRILTMEYVEGLKVSDIRQLREHGYDLGRIAERGFGLLMQQIFVNGFFHADPHPGNLLILDDEVICFLDFGVTGRISQRERENFIDLISNIVRMDEARLLEALLRLCMYEEEPDRTQLSYEVGDVVDRYFHIPGQAMDFGRFAHHLLEVLERRGVSLRPNLYIMIKSLSMVENMAKTLDPGFDVVEHVKPFVKRVQAKRYSPTHVFNELFLASVDAVRLAKDLPFELRSILHKANKGKVKLEFEHKGLAPLLSTLDRIANRIAFAMVLSAFVIGSALVVLSGLPPTWGGIPVVGIIGFVIAAVMALWLLITILRSGRM